MSENEIPAAIPRRLVFVDALRGFALFGVFGANLMIFSGLTYMTDEQKARVSTFGLDRLVSMFELLFIENKFMGLFSILFGISFWLFLDRARARGGAATTLFYRRIGWLFVIGALHGWLLWCFDILRFYALWAVLLPLFVRVPLRRLFAAGVGMSVLVPALVAGIRGMLPHVAPAEPSLDTLTLAAFSSGRYAEVLSANWKYDWHLTNSVGQVAYQVAVFGRLLLGLFVARAVDLGNLERYRVALRNLVLLGVVIGVGGNSLFVSSLFEDATGFFLPFVRRLGVESGFLGLTLAIAAGFALLHVSPRWKRAIQSLAPLGQMALTFYLFQTLLGLWLFYGFMPGPHLMGRIGPTGVGFIWVSGYLLQVVMAHAWMRAFRFGPAEWLWRCLTYRKMQPLRAAAAAAA